MKTLTTTLLVFSFIFSGLLTPLFSQTSEQLYQKGMIKEEGEGSLQEAIELYKQVVDQSNSDRSLKAKALFQIGICYQKMGNQEAENAFQRLIQEFGEQTEIVREAQKQLSILQSYNPEQNESSGIIMKQVWPDAGGGAQGGTLSSDGRFLSHTDLATGNLAYRELSTGKTRLLTKEGSWSPPMQFNAVSSVSPDDKQIAYGWYNEEGIHEIHLTNIENPQAKVIFSKKGVDAFPFSWSPDGNKLIIQTFDKSYTPKAILLTPSTGGIEELPLKGLTVQGGINFSSDGKYIIYDSKVEKDKNKKDIMIMSADGTTESVLVEHPANDLLLGWIPNSNEVMFLSDRSGTWDAWIVAVLDGKPSGESKRILPEIGKISCIDFTKDGAFYFRYNTHKNAAFIAPLSEDTPVIDMDLATLFMGSNYSLEFSPSGKYVVYTKEVTHPNNQGGLLNKVFIYNNQTKEEKELPMVMAVRRQVWSPDEKSLFYIGHAGNKLKLEENNGGVYQIDVETCEFEPILLFPTTDNADVNKHWYQSRVVCSKDQSSIYYLYDNQISKRDISNGKETVIVKDMVLARFLDLSPDGKNILFGTLDEDNQTGRVLSMPVDGGQVNEIFSSQKGNTIDYAKWSSDGESIFFNQSHDNGRKGSSVWNITSNGQNPQNIWQSKDMTSSLSINPDGSQIAISAFRHEVECWRMSNYRSK